MAARPRASQFFDRQNDIKRGLDVNSAAAFIAFASVTSALRYGFQPHRSAAEGHVRLPSNSFGEHPRLVRPHRCRRPTNWRRRLPCYSTIQLHRYRRDARRCPSCAARRVLHDGLPRLQDGDGFVQAERRYRNPGNNP